MYGYTSQILVIASVPVNFLRNAMTNMFFHKGLFLHGVNYRNNFHLNFDVLAEPYFIVVKKMQLLSEHPSMLNQLSNQ